MFAYAASWGSEAYVDSCHYTPETFAELGREVAGFLKNHL
jgi:hypothetical protein